MENKLKIGSIVKHIRTGTKFKIDKIGKTEISGIVFDIGDGSIYTKPGSRNKTSKHLIGKTYEIVNESIFWSIIREELSSLNEILIEDPEIAKQVDELSSLVNQIKSLKEQLKLMENNAKQIEDILRPILDGLKDTEERILETQSSVAYIERRGYDTTKMKYKEAYLLALTKVNAKVKLILQEALSATAETTYVKSGISARPNEGKIVKEGFASFFSGLWGKLKGFVSKLKSHNSDIKKYNDIIKKLSK